MAIDYWCKFEEGQFYHIYNRAINKDQLFAEEDNYRFFLGKWKLYLYDFVDVYAFCLMPNHIHFIVRIKVVDADYIKNAGQNNTRRAQMFLEENVGVNAFLEDQFKRLFSSYTLAFNKQQNRSGSLLQKRFKRVHIRNDARLTDLICYVHHNPIHHKIAENFSSWKWSSYNSILSEHSTLVMRELVLLWFNNSDTDLSTKSFEKYHIDYKGYEGESHLLLE